MTPEAKKKMDEMAPSEYAAVGHSGTANTFFKKGFEVGYQMQEEKINSLKARLGIADEALLWAEEMFIARDEMNAKVHCSPVRFSEITLRVRQARAALKADEEAGE